KGVRTPSQIYASVIIKASVKTSTDCFRQNENLSRLYWTLLLLLCFMPSMFIKCDLERTRLGCHLVLCDFKWLIVVHGSILYIFLLDNIRQSVTHRRFYIISNGDYCIAKKHPAEPGLQGVSTTTLWNSRYAGLKLASKILLDKFPVNNLPEVF